MEKDSLFKKVFSFYRRIVFSCYGNNTHCPLQLRNDPYFKHELRIKPQHFTISRYMDFYRQPTYDYHTTVAGKR